MYQTLTPELIDEILMRLGLGERPKPDYAGLAALYRAWCFKVPFDNLFKRLFLHGDSTVSFPGENDTLFFSNWLRYGTGGTCWSGNGALQALLASLGFNASRRRGTMLIGRSASPNHGSVTVELGEVLYLVDASMLHDEPLVLHPTRKYSIGHEAWGLSSQPEGGNWLVRWRPLHLPEGCLCRIESGEILRQEWLARNNLTRRVSPFNDSLYARKNIGNDVVGVEHGARVVFYGDGRVVREALTHRQLLECLGDELGIAGELLQRLPEDDKECS